MSWSYASAALNVEGARFQALWSELQTHEAELLLTARTDDVLAARLVVLYFHSTGGAGPDRGAGSDTWNLRKCNELAVLEKLQVVVGAVGVVAAVRAWGSAHPWLQTLPTEFVCFLLVNCADGAVHIEVGQIFPLHISLAPRTLGQEEQ